MIILLEEQRVENALGLRMLSEYRNQNGGSSRN
jgi:hypothetical protein